MIAKTFDKLLPLFQELKFEAHDDREGWYVDCDNNLPCDNCTKAFNQTACPLSLDVYLTSTQLQQLQDTYPENFI